MMSDKGTAVKNQALKGVLLRTIALGIFLAVALAFLQSTIVFIPGMCAAVLLYAASVTGVMVRGKFAVPLCRSLQVLAITLFCALLISAPELRAEARGIGLPILLLGAVWAVHFISKAYSDLTGVTTRALLIALAGNLYYSLLSASGVLFLPQLASVVLIGFAAAAASAFIGVLGRHSNPRVSFVGKAFSGLWNPGLIGAAVAIVMTYLAFVRPSLLTLGPIAVTVIEWAAMCMAIFWLFRKIKSALRADEALIEGKEFGDGHKVTGVLSYEKGELEKAAAKVGEFVETGRKDGLITLTTMALTRNGVPPEAVESVISIIINYTEDPVPPVALRWAVGDRESAGRMRRAKAAEAMLAAAVAAIGAESGRTGDNGNAGPEKIIPAIPAR
jgi:hypothetical protein